MPSISDDKINTYLEQMIHNPYLYELKEKIFNGRKNILRKIWGNIDLTNEQIYIIFDNINNEDDLNLIKNNLDKIDNDNFKSDVQKIIMNNITIIPTPIRISTMTVCCNLEINIVTSHIYDDFIPPDDILIDNKLNPNLNNIIIGCKIKDNIKGYFKKKKTVIKTFFNSITLNILIDQNCINLKIFNNGKIQMTGVKNDTLANNAINLVKKLINSNRRYYENVNGILKVSGYKTVLINSDYDCGFKIERDNLCNLLISQFNLSVNYEPENYPGVKIGYFWNTYNNIHHTGVCNCVGEKCDGKGKGGSINNCKKVTISIFQSGKIIITGGNALTQINNAYDFINKILFDNYFEIKKKYYIKYYKDEIVERKKKNNYNILIYKKNILNYEEYNPVI